MTELGLVEWLRKAAGRSPRLAAGIGDDCAIYRPKSGEDLLLKSDQLIERAHFRSSLAPGLIGERALARALSDIAAMGGTPKFCLLSLALPSWADTRWVDDFYKGLLNLAHAMKADKFARRPLNGPQTVALLFDKPSLRTRVSFTAGVAELGVRSILVIPLSPRGVNAAVSMYANSEDAFDADEEFVGRAFAAHAGIALAHAELEANLRTALQSRERIGQAVGILMERHRITATQAFDLLVYASQRTHRKLRDLANWVVATGEDPHRLVKNPKHTESTAKRQDPG